MEEMIRKVQAYERKLNAYNLALTTMSFDQSTIAPKKGADYRIEMMSILSGEQFDYMIDPENIKMLEEALKTDLGPVMNEEVQQLCKNVFMISKLPRDFYISYGQLMDKSYMIWEKAKHANDYSMFKDTLKQVIEMSKKRTEYIYGSVDYDKMLDEYEEGMNMEKYDAFFDKIKKDLLPFIQRVVKEGKQIDDSKLHQIYPADKQAKAMDIINAYMNFDKEICYMGETEHPFTSGFSLNDVRITTKYVEDDLTSSIFSVVHEYGHAQYMFQVDPAYEGMQIGGAMTSGMHESQSRLLENYIARRKSYWVNNFEAMREIFSEQLKDVTLDEFIKMINVSKPSLIRTDADELTYPIHILIRYELEKVIMKNEIDLDNLDQAWDDKYEEYLGVRASKASEGILQDVHWSGGSFGYFPTYALGSAYAAQFMRAMEKDLDVDKELENNNFKAISDWLKEKIHQYGAFKKPEEVMEIACHEKFDPQVYIDYLINKYSKLYELN